MFVREYFFFRQRNAVGLAEAVPGHDTPHLSGDTAGKDENERLLPMFKPAMVESDSAAYWVSGSTREVHGRPQPTQKDAQKKNVLYGSRILFYVP